MKHILKRLNIINSLEEDEASFWQRPQLFFLVMGLVNIAIILVGYAIGTRLIDDPLVVATIVVAFGLSLLIINFGLTRGFEKIAEANRLKSEFIRIVSHQLRTPISNCVWATEFLLSERLGKIEKKQRKYFEILKENTDRMQELISKLLTVSRIEGGTLAFEKAFFPLEDLTKDLVSKFKPLAEVSNVEILFKAEPNLPKVLGDSSQIKVVVENLLDNAIRYAALSQELQKKKEKVEIRLKPRKNYLYFEIEDNGIGISEFDRKYIFQKFFRGDKVLKYRTEGSGLGLYISKSIVEKSGGRIGFKSELGKGSTFWFTLPIK